MPANYVSRAEVAATIIEERSGEIITAAIEQSVAMNAFRRVTVGSDTLRYTIINKLPTAQWLTANAPDPAGDLDPKPTTDIGFDKVDVTVEELATIVVIPDNVRDDSSIDLYAEVRARCAEAIGRLIDQTIFFGTARYRAWVTSTWAARSSWASDHPCESEVTKADSGGRWRSKPRTRRMPPKATSSPSRSP